MSDSQVEDVKSKVDIVSVIGDRIELKKAGRNYKANCPFHGEKTPSFMVSPELQIFKCFGCDESGDVFTFLQKYEGMDFPEALKYLADKVGIKLQRSQFTQTSERDKVVEINSQALRLYNYLLTRHQAGKVALNYLIKERGIKKETIEEFQLGFSPDKPNLLKKFLVDKGKFTFKEILKAGIVVQRGENVYDRFGGRIIFPLFDHRGNPVGFAGRVLPWDKRETGKYINSPETPAYHKSKILYGLNTTRLLIKKKGVAIVVEGELDAISSYQAGIKNVVAIKGSSLTEDQARLLSRFANKFVLALDSDIAGNAAARRGITIAANLGVEVKVARITKYKDPDEAARNDLENYKRNLINAQGVWDYIIDSVFLTYKNSSGPGKAKISKELSPVLADIEDKIVQAHYTNLVARRLEVPQEAVLEQVEKTVGLQKPQTLTSTPSRTDKNTEKRDRRELLEDRLFSLTFRSSVSFLASPQVQKLITTSVNKRILEELNKFMSQKNKFDLGQFASKLPPELLGRFANMVLNDSETLTEGNDILDKELDLVIKELKILGVKENLKKLATQIHNLEEMGEADNLLTAQNKFNKLAKKLAGYEEEDGEGIIVKDN